MKSITTLSVLLLALSINVTAQVKGPRTFEPRNQPHHDPVPQNNNSQNAHHWGNGWGGGHPNTYVSFNFGYVNPYPYNNYCGNGYSIKKATRYSIRAAGQIINQAVAFDSWNDMYSPILAKAIRHYNYAQQLYWWGNYQAAYNHAERARYLAWYSLQYFQNPNCDGGYNNGYIEPDPYSDPYNPYYKTQHTNGKISQQPSTGNISQDISKDHGLDKVLPDSNTNDKELIKSFNGSEMKDE